MPIKLAQVLAGAKIGGAENFYTRMVTTLAEQPSLQQMAFTRPHDLREAEFHQAGVPVSLHRLGSRWHWLAQRRYVKALQAWDPEIVVTYMNRASSLTPAGKYKLVARLGHYYDLKYYRHCDYWIGISKGICDHLINGGMPADRVFHLSNFVDETDVAAVTRESVGVEEGVPIVLAAGRLHTNKGFDILLQAMVSVPDAVLVLAGDGPEYEALVEQAESLGLTPRVRFLGWRNDVAALMKMADVFVCPSRHEGLGSIVLEAWFHHCPIVATNSQGPGELIDHQNTGLISPIDEVAPLAEHINQVLSEASIAENLADNAYQRYQTSHSRAIIGKQYTDFFHQLVGR